jgi:hypothetical protein
MPARRGASAAASVGARLRAAWRRSDTRGLAAALAIFLFCLGSLFPELIVADWRESVIANAPNPRYEPGGRWENMGLNDLRFVVAVLDRNAETLVTAPGELYQLGHCHPHPNALALGESLIAPAVLGIPVIPLDDPLVTFNFVLVVSTLLAALSMYVLVTEWTGVRTAGIVAGVLYAFHFIRMRDPVHFFVWENTWTILALVFARRLFVKPRWRDALALSACCAMQIAGSIYPLLAAVAIAGPMAVWFVVAYGLHRVRPLQIATVVAVIGGVAWAVFTPYLELQTGGELVERSSQLFLSVRSFAPGQMFFPGAVIYGLAALGLLLLRGPWRVRLDADPRWALLAAGFLCLALATGGTAGEEAFAVERGRPPPSVSLPNLWSGIGRIVPGLDVVRSPAALISGVHTILCILAGFGTAFLVDRAPRPVMPWVAAALVAVAYVDTLRPAVLGLTPRQSYRLVELRPDPERLAFFRELEAKGNDGPLYEIDLPRRLKPTETVPLLAAAYHRRPTSKCYNSYGQSPADALWSEVADPAVLAELHAMGFTTLLMHPPRFNPEGHALLRQIGALRRRTGDRYLEYLGSGGGLRAWRITGAPPLAGSRSDPKAAPVAPWRRPRPSPDPVPPDAGSTGLRRGAD